MCGVSYYLVCHLFNVNSITDDQPYPYHLCSINIIPWYLVQYQSCTIRYQHHTIHTDRMNTTCTMWRTYTNTVLYISSFLHVFNTDARTQCKYCSTTELPVMNCFRNPGTRHINSINSINNINKYQQYHTISSHCSSDSIATAYRKISIGLLYCNCIRISNATDTKKLPLHLTTTCPVRLGLDYCIPSCAALLWCISIE